MDSSISATAYARDAQTRYPHNASSGSLQVSGALEGSSVQQSLFEQILSLPIGVSEVPQAKYDDPPSHESDDIAEPESSHEHESEERSTSETETTNESNNDIENENVVASAEDQLAIAAPIVEQKTEVDAAGDQVESQADAPDQTLVISQDTNTSSEDEFVDADEAVVDEIALSNDDISNGEQAEADLGSRELATTDEQASNDDGRKSQEKSQSEDLVVQKRQSSSDSSQRDSGDLSRTENQDIESVGEQPLERPTEETSHGEQPSNNRRDKTLKWFESEPNPTAPPPASRTPAPSSVASETHEANLAGTHSNDAKIAVPEDVRGSVESPTTASHTNTSTAGVQSTLPVQGNVSSVSRSQTADPNSVNGTSNTAVDRPGAPTTSSAKNAQTSTAEQSGTSEADGVSQQERVRLIQRIARSFNRLGPTGGQINLKLHPPHLGSLAVQVRMEGRSMAAKLTTESSAAREVIMENLPVLRSRLAEQGYEVSQFQVDVADNQADASAGGPRDQTEDARQNADRRGRTVLFHRTSPSQSANTASEPSTSRPLSWFAGNSIDVHA